MRQDFVIIDGDLHKAGDSLKFLYGKAGAVSIQSHPNPDIRSRFVLLLEPNQFVILQ